MLRYGLYARKSDDDRSVTEKSIGEQVAACEKIAADQDLIIVKTWEESRSAKVPGIRSAYRELVAEIQKGEIDGILCWHLNRLARNMQEGGELVQLLVDGKIREIRTPTAIYHPEDNILPIVVEAASATQYSRDLSATVKRSMTGNFERGNCNHRAPQGYKNARSAINLKRGIIEVDEERFDKIRASWDLMLSGRYSITAVVNHLNNELDYLTRFTKRGGGTPFAKSSAYAMFRNPFYMGVVRYRGKYAPGNHRPMVTPDEFAAVQVLLERDSFSAPRKVDHAFTGLMRCKHCGFQVTVERKKLRNGTYWTNYRCSDPKLRCTKRGIDAETISRRIARSLAHIKIDPAYIPIAMTVIRDALRKLKTDDATQEALDAQLVTVEERIRNLEEMGLAGLIRDPKRYRMLQDQEFEKKKELWIQRERQKVELDRMRRNAERALKYVGFAEKSFGRAAPRQQGSIASLLAETYTFDGVSKHIEIRIKPLLREIVRFVRSQIQPIEPQENGSENKKELAFANSFLFGGPSSPEIELPSALLKELRGPLFPEFPIPLGEAGMPIEGAKTQFALSVPYIAKQRKQRKAVLRKRAKRGVRSRLVS